MISDYTETSIGEDSVDSQSFERTISERVIRSVAAAKNEDPVEMQPSLYEAINPDALDALFESDSISVEFTWQGYRIGIDENGTINVADVE